jgi:hypothetical protein
MTDVKLALRGLRGESAADVARRVLDLPDATDSEALAALLGLDLPTVYPVAQNEGDSTANAIVASAAPDLTAYAADQLFFYRHLGVANTAAGPTKNIDGLGAKTTSRSATISRTTPIWKRLSWRAA